MEAVKDEISLALKQTKIEIFDGFEHQIISNDLEEKNMLKQLLKQTKDEYFTVIEVDFIKSENKILRKAKCKFRFAEQNNDRLKQNLNQGIKYVETFNFRPDGPIIRVYNSSIFIYGEYIKLSRTMSQTPLCISGKFKTERCVSDFIYIFKDFFGSSDIKFIASGREDIDVRCLEGRSFILEVIKPTKNLNMIKDSLRDDLKVSQDLRNISMQAQLYPEVDLINLSIVNKSMKNIVTKESPDKLYNLLIYSDRKINFSKVYELKQNTPLRVLHRRANICRDRSIEVLKLKEMEYGLGFYYDVDIRTTSGTYVKEWVNGDFGRTMPNLGADLLELDVIKVEFIVPEENIICGISIQKDVYC